MNRARFKSLATLALATALSAFAPFAHAASYLYELRGTNSNNIWRVDPAAPSENLIVTAYPGGNAATISQCPSGYLYYVVNATNGAVYRWDPATPASPPTLLGNLGGGIPGALRFACDSSGTLYYLPDTGRLYTLNPATGTATFTGATITGTGSGGDMAFSAAGSLYILNSSRQLFIASTAGGAASAQGTLSGIANNSATLGLAFDSAGNLYAQSQNPAGLYQLTGTAATLVIALNNTDTGATGDLASVVLAVSNVGVAKSFSPGVIVVNGASTLTVTLSNSNATALRAAAFTDIFPGGVVVAPIPSLFNTCGGTATAAAGASSLGLIGGTIPAAGSCSISVNVTSSSAGVYLNTIAARAVTTALAYNDGPAAATLTVKLPMTLSKSSAPFSDPVNGTTNPKRIPGAFVDYTIAAANPGAGVIDSNTVIITDKIPVQTELFVGNVGAGGPVAFTDGLPSSGLTYTFGTLASGTDDVEFSSDGGVTWNYSPTANANGVDPAVTDIRIRPKGSFNSAANFQVRFRVRVK